MTSRVPAGAHDFIEVEAYQSIYERLNHPNAPAIALILTGTSGVGKTEIALQVMRRFENERRTTGQNNVLKAQFNCDSVDNLVSDLRRFADLKDLRMPALRNGDSDLETVFTQFYHEIDCKFPDHLKCFIFDDAEKPTQVVRHLDQSICSTLQMAQNLYKSQRWKIIITTQDAGQDWVYGCNHLTTDRFIHVQGFNEDETFRFFGAQGRGSLTREEIREVRANLGVLPLSLQVVRFEIRRNQLSDTAPFLKQYLDRINKVDLLFSLNNKSVAALHVSLNRLAEQSSRTAECKELIRLLTLPDEKNFTSEMLVSYAEVIHPHNGNQTGYALANEFIDEMVKRSLCEEPRRLYDTRLISFHKLVKQSMTLCRQPYNVESEVVLVRKALLALTRVIPKDGRMHQSHSLFGFMYNHARALETEIEKLRTQNDISRERTPCIMLMYVNLLMAMGYCQLACRVPAEHAMGYLKKALDVYSTLMTGVRYTELQALDPDRPVEVQKAETLFRESTGANSPLLHDEYYMELVKDVPRYYRLTRRDLKFMLDDNSVEWDLTNGHLVELQLLELENRGKVLDAEKLRLFYPVELLAELYSLWSKARGFHGESAQLTGKCVECSKAALLLYSRVKETYDVTLLAEVITRREGLKIHLNLDDDQLHDLAQHRVQRMTLEDIVDEWRELEQRSDKAFEYGLMRTDFGKDNYNRFLCQEGLADCLGRRCQMLQDVTTKETLYAEGENLFQSLIERSKTECLNLQTTCKTHRHYAEFLWRCDKKCEAIRSIIDAMYYLNLFLHEKEQLNFPEQQESCGKFKPLHLLLIQYYEGYQKEPTRVPVLRTDGADALRLSYLTKFVDAWKQHETAVQAGGNDKFQVMEEILNESGVDTEDDNMMQVAPSQATT